MTTHPWEKAFDEKFGSAGSGGTYSGVRDEGIKSFIRELVAAARQKGRKAGLDDLYNRVNAYVGAEDNPNYQFPEAHELIEMIEAARSGSEPLPDSN